MSAAGMDLARVSRSEICRYLGAKNGKTDEAGYRLIEDVLAELNTKIRPAFLSRTFPLTVEEVALPVEEGVYLSDEDAAKERFLRVSERTEKPLIDLTCFRIRSESLYRNLHGCDEVILFAATLGEGADFLIRRYEKVKMSRAAVCQAASAAMIEAYCNMLCDSWKAEYAEKGRRIRPRFACGFGDFPLTYQHKFMQVLEMEKRLGIRLNDSLLMVPTKSVTALVGVESSSGGDA